jgi:hypothetical protein
MLNGMVEDIWKFLQPKLDAKFDEQTKMLKEINDKLTRIETKLGK